MAQRYCELTGDDLPSPLLLPEPPAIIEEYQLDLDTLHERIDRLL